MDRIEAFDLLIFDCDGVLVDSEPLVNRLYVEMLGELGHVLDYEQSLSEFAGAAMTTRLQAFSQRLGWTASEEFPAKFEVRLYKAMAKELLPVAGVQDVLSNLQVLKCVASNGSLKEIAFRLHICGLAHYFGNALFSGTMVPRPKPYPDVFLAAAGAFGVVPSRCAVVEDSLTGVKAAVRAGMKVFGYSAHTKACELTGAGAIAFASMDELPGLLRSQSLRV